MAAGTEPDTGDGAPRFDVLIPALNEEASLPLVLADLRAARPAPRRIIVIDNGSTDRTAELARADGATVLHEPRRGYGAACLRGLRYLDEAGAPPEVVVFVDADRADDALEVGRLLSQIAAGADLVLGSRVLGRPERGALQPAQRLGNLVATTMIRLLYGQRCTDLGPFRAIRYQALLALRMSDPDYGWTVEMQVKAARRGLRTVEVPVRYRPRAGGASKVSGTVRGSVLAGYKILSTILRHAVLQAP